VLAVGNDGQFTALCERLGVPDLVEDARFATNSSRVANGDALRYELEACLSERPASAWVGLLNNDGVPAGEVNDISGAFAFAERLGLDPIVEVPREDGTVARLTRNPIRLSATPVQYRLAPSDVAATRKFHSWERSTCGPARASR
jgi:crotonobetainyl-CoA:carnitine CoA-transferase CaiB-like acyl-CoA transferase